MSNWNNVELLEILESYAADENRLFKGSYIESEEMLSEMFDDLNADWLRDNEDDQPAIDQEFNDWTDMLCKDGTLHPEQYKNYCYVGKYAE